MNKTNYSSFNLSGTSTPQKPHKSSARVPELLREARLKSKMAQQSDDEPDQDEVEAALDEIEKEEHISKGKSRPFVDEFSSFC